MVLLKYRTRQVAEKVNTLFARVLLAKIGQAAISSNLPSWLLNCLDGRRAHLAHYFTGSFFSFLAETFEKDEVSVESYRALFKSFYKQGFKNLEILSEYGDLLNNSSFEKEFLSFGYLGIAYFIFESSEVEAIHDHYLLEQKKKEQGNLGNLL